MEPNEQMKIIAGDRATGRTTELIKIAIERNAYILVHNMARAHFIRQLSVKMGLPQLLFPITLHEFLANKNHGFVNDLLIDDADELLQSLAFSQGWRLKAISICKRKESFIELTKNGGEKMDESKLCDYCVYVKNNCAKAIVINAEHMLIKEYGGECFYVFLREGRNVAAFPVAYVDYVIS